MTNDPASNPAAAGHHPEPADDTGTDVVTGAFGYSGAAIASALIAEGREVRTLTGHPGRAPAGSQITVHPLAFDDFPALVTAMAGATTLYNTYWIRFAHGGRDHGQAVSHSRVLFRAAREAGIRRIVHLSITNPSLDLPFPYFRGKAQVEQDLAATGVPHAILRPAILFGGNDVLVNNIAWLLRRSPLFAVGDRGDYRIRGIHVDDLARLCVAHGRGRETTVVDAVGPERPTFRELVEAVRGAVGSRSRIVRVPGAAVPVLTRALGLAVRDVLLTRDEYRAMAAGLADSDAPTTGPTAISTWLADHGSVLGRRYAHELGRHFSPNDRTERAS
ncbi:epimerase [Streptomyces tateyamensis]|uniref:Epimerase n=1 Tax=Streptomyces tateyamensis TaxID=565073 RepID=A0A2V4NHQ1_9ACTN|nr:NAD(P)H-binding protein [Streptomyces tateyamensis]PYC65346.1 epimerase [Streptomyces tateyamensis]